MGNGTEEIVRYVIQQAPASPQFSWPTFFVVFYTWIAGFTLGRLAYEEDPVSFVQHVSIILRAAFWPATLLGALVWRNLK